MNDIMNYENNNNNDNMSNINYINQQNNDNSKVLFEDSVVNEIIANNSKDISNYKLNTTNNMDDTSKYKYSKTILLNPELKSNYVHHNNEDYNLSVIKLTK